MSDGLRIVWLPVNQAWAVLWGESLLRICNERTEAYDYVAEIRRDAAKLAELRENGAGEPL